MEKGECQKDYFIIFKRFVGENQQFAFVMLL